jgi:hypothetical protein
MLRCWLASLLARWPEVRRHRLRIQERRLRLAQVRFVKPNHPIRERDARPDRRLDQPLQVERDVVVLVPEKLRGGVIAAQSSEGECVGRGKASLRPHDDAAVQPRGHRQDRGVVFFDHPVDFRIRHRALERRQHRQRVHDVPERAQAHDQDLHFSRDNRSVVE